MRVDDDDVRLDEPQCGKAPRCRVERSRVGCNRGGGDRRGIDGLRNTCGGCSNVTLHVHTYDSKYKLKKSGSLGVCGTRSGTGCNKHWIHKGGIDVLEMSVEFGVRNKKGYIFIEVGSILDMLVSIALGKSKDGVVNLVSNHSDLSVELLEGLMLCS